MSRIIEIIDSDDDSPCTTTTNAIIESNDGQQSQSRRRPRKSVLHVMQDPEVQFETIAVDDDNNSDPKEGNSRPKSDNLIRPQQQQRTAKTTPKILAPKPPSNADAIQSAFEEYMTRIDAKECLAIIAHERVRVNYLLSMFGMPEINFSLYTQPEILQFQFEERLKQQKMMQNWSSNRMQGENRGRSLLQNNNEQETS